MANMVKAKKGDTRWHDENEEEFRGYDRRGKSKGWAKTGRTRDYVRWEFNLNRQ